MRCRILFSITLLLSVFLANASEPQARLPPGLTMEERSSRLQIESAVLGKPREIWVRQSLPSLSPSQTKIRLYILDADWLFPMIANHIDYLSFTGRLPAIDVIGVVNDNRNTDFLVPTDNNFPHSGGGEKFQQFLTIELVKHVDSKFGKSQHNILLGHSFGGVASLTAMASSQNVFKSFITMGSSTWIANDWPINKTKSWLEDSTNKSPEFLYMSVAEFDGGTTVPKGKEYAALFSRFPMQGLEFHFEVIPQTDHFSAVMPSFINALNALFPEHGFATKVKRIKTAESLNTLFQQEKQHLSWRFWPNGNLLSLHAYDLARSGNKELSEALVQNILAVYPHDAESHALGGYVAFANQNQRLAASRLKRAIKIAEIQMSNPNRVLMYQSVLDRINPTQ